MAINKDASLRVYFMNKEEIKHFSTEIPYWQEVRLNLDKNGLRQSLLNGGRSSTGNEESLYFNKKNKLIYAIRTPRRW
ncbi:MAG: hypothetical protein U5L96_20380 [Owenweeksia sp.]|nr:hypothetical protein [Owenweeksia sp.]